MKIIDQVVVVTGGAHGIGRALCERFHRAGAKVVIVADRDFGAAQVVALAVRGSAFHCDVAQEEDIVRLVTQTEARFGPIGLFCSNAGIAVFGSPQEHVASGTNELWSRSWAVNVMAHVYAARALVPLMKARGAGYFLLTVSAAGLLTQIDGPIYATTKHAAVGFAESLAITHRDDGIRVSILCPQGVDTPMLRSLPRGPQHLDGVLSAEAVADTTVAGIESENFLILPHPQVERYMQRKVADYNRWIGGMAKLRRSLQAPDS